MRKIKIQQDFCRNLLAKKIKLKESNETLKEVHISSIGRWQSEKSSPSLKDVEMILKNNDMPQPFFYDGTMETLIDFIEKEIKKFNLKITYEKL